MLTRLNQNLKKIPVAIAAFIALSCSEQVTSIGSETSIVTTDNTSTASHARAENMNAFNETVGAPIDLATGEQWIDNYEQAENQSKTYTIKVSALNKILSIKNCVGVSLVYALDSTGKLHTLAIGVDSNGKQMASNKVYTQNGDIKWKTAQCWIANYTGTVSSHFFGQNTFKRLWANGYYDVLVTFAIDDKNNPQLLLTAKVPNSSSGKTAARLSFEDASSPCPPVCPK
jgi:hypothetical protein